MRTEYSVRTPRRRIRAMLEPFDNCRGRFDGPGETIPGPPSTIYRVQYGIAATSNLSAPENSSTLPSVTPCPKIILFHVAGREYHPESSGEGIFPATKLIIPEADPSLP